MIFKIGDYIDGTIIIIEDDRAFALVANIFKCYIPIEEMTYNTIGHTAFEFVNLNENVKLKIKQIDYIENQMVCTLKSKIDMPNPYKNYKENEQYKAKIIQKTNFGLFVEIDNKALGYADIKHIYNFPTKYPLDLFSIGDVIDVCILNYNETNNRFEVKIQYDNNTYKNDTVIIETRDKITDKKIRDCHGNKKVFSKRK